MQNQKQESPTGEKIITIKLKKDRMIILSDFIHQTTEGYSFIRTTQYIYEENNQYVLVR
jgi:transcription termination factor Rho